MIICIQHPRPKAVLDCLLAAFDASIPVANEHEVTIGNCWMVERGNQVIVLDTIESGALQLWAVRGKDVIIAEWPEGVDDDWAADNVLFVVDKPGAYPASAVVSEGDEQDMADLIETTLDL